MNKHHKKIRFDSRRIQLWGLSLWGPSAAIPSAHIPFHFGPLCIWQSSLTPKQQQMQMLKMNTAKKAILLKHRNNTIIQYLVFRPHQTTEEHIPFHNVFPYRGRLYMQLNRQGSPPNKTFLRASLPRHIGCSKSGQFPQTVVYQAEIA